MERFQSDTHSDCLFESSGVPVNIVDEMDSWLKYHVSFENPIAGALLKAADQLHFESLITGIFEK